MTLMQRRRALMARNGDNILWEWKPSDGLSSIDIRSVNGSVAQYTLLDDAIRIFGNNSFSNGVQIFPKNQISFSGDVTILATIKQIGGPTKAQIIFISSRCVTGNWSLGGIRVRANQLAIIGDPDKTIDYPITLPGTLTLSIMRNSNLANFEYDGQHLETSLKTTTPSYQEILLYQTDKTTNYVDVTSLKVIKGVYL